MTVEYLPNGVKCNLSCTYCYQDPMRAAGNFSAPSDFARVKETLKQQGAPFAIFGGEPLLTPKDQLEEIFKFGFEQFGRNSIQTNGLLIDADHVLLFKKYKVGVGVSIDGPGLLNSPRCGLTDTAEILFNLEVLLRAQLSVSIIITIHRANARPELFEFLSWLSNRGLKYLNLHILEVDSERVRKELALSSEENFEIFRKIYDWSKRGNQIINPFDDIIKLLTERSPNVSCIWNACDAINTGAVQGVNASGDLTNCGRTNKDGVNWLKSASSGKERYLALYHTSQEFGGCKDCKYFYACKGQCPGTAIDGDWRNKTSHCQFWYSLIEYIWQDMMPGKIPIFSEQEMYRIGAQFVSSISNPTSHAHGDSPHGDSPHGDSHGDHTDAGFNSRVSFGAGVEGTWKD